MSRKDLVVLGLLGKGKTGTSHLATLRGRYVVLKEMNGVDSCEHEVAACETLRRLGIEVPEILYSSNREGYLVKEFIRGSTAAAMVVSGFAVDDLISRVLGVEEDCRRSGINIDYFPSNFVVSDRGLFYVDYEVTEYCEEWNFRNWGIFYWLNADGMRRFLETENDAYINLSGSRRPLVHPAMRARRDGLVAAFERK